MEGKHHFGRMAVLAAFRTEIEEIASRAPSAGGAPLRAGPLTYVLLTIQGIEVLAGSTGMGKVRSASATQAAIDLFKPDAVIQVGTAGALEEGVNPGDLVLCDFLVEHDTGPGDPEPVDTDQGLSLLLLEAARSVGKVHQGGMATGDRPVLDSRERDRIQSRHNAKAVDMEAAATARVASLNGVPVAVLKGITDSADRKGMEEFKRNVKAAAKRAQQAVLAFLCKRGAG